MESPGSVSLWLNKLDAKDQVAIQQLWERYFHRLVGLARQQLLDFPLGLADEEDVALSAFDSFFRRAEQGRFPRLNDRDDLWQILATIVTRKSINLRKHESRARRDQRLTHSLAVPVQANREQEPPLVTVLADHKAPDPAMITQLTDQCRHLLQQLPDQQKREVALMKMAGHTNREIAEELGVVISTIERWLRLIRKQWEQELATEEPPSSSKEND